MFNTGKYYERLQAGELVALLQSDRHPSKPAAREPYCTRSQIVHYYEKNSRRLTKVAIVHQYVRADGQLGASGLPDPKRLIVGDTIYSAELAPTRHSQ